MARLTATSLVTALPASYATSPSTTFVPPAGPVGSEMPRESTVPYATSS